MIPARIGNAIWALPDRSGVCALLAWNLDRQFPHQKHTMHLLRANAFDCRIRAFTPDPFPALSFNSPDVHRNSAFHLRRFWELFERFGSTPRKDFRQEFFCKMQRLKFFLCCRQIVRCDSIEGECSNVISTYSNIFEPNLMNYGYSYPRSDH